MASMNKLGALVVGVTALVLLGGYGAWKGVAFVLSSIHQTNGQQKKNTVAATPSPTPLSEADIQKLRTNLVHTLGASGSYTSQYLTTLPPNLQQSQVLDQTRVQAFVNQNQGQLLPTIAPNEIKTTTATGKDAIKGYLDTISSATNPAIKSVTSDDIQTAYQNFYADPQHSTALKDVETSLQNNVNALQGVATPSEAMDIQTKLLAASQSLLSNVQLLETMPKDLMGGLIAAKNIQDLGPVFAGIQTDIDALQKKV